MLSDKASERLTRNYYLEKGVSINNFTISILTESWEWKVNFTKDYNVMFSSKT